MDFIDQLKQFSGRVESMKSSIFTEEATKTSIIMPFFAMLGYDIFNPQEFIPEFTADVGIKKGEKVDYAIVLDGNPAILVEAKSINENLDSHDSQLFRYFGTTKAKFAILTNGISYRFYTDLEEPNKMDSTPFLDINILDVKENQVSELKKFHKNAFSIDEISSAASGLKYSNEFKVKFASLLAAPSDDFIKLFLQDIYSGIKTQSVIDKFGPILKKALNDFISETMNDKIKTALGTNNDGIPAPVIETEPEAPAVAAAPRITTTEEELEAFFIVKNMLKEVAPMQDITYKDTETYFGILYKNNSRKWICRFKLKESSKSLILPDENKKEVRYPISSVYDTLDYTDRILETVKNFMI